MDIIKLVDEMTAENQAELLTELMKRERIAVHVESKNETLNVDDIYDNSDSSSRFGDADKILSIIYIDDET